MDPMNYAEVAALAFPVMFFGGCLALFFVMLGRR